MTVVGGAGLLGRAFCKGIAAQGAVVVAADIDKSAVDVLVNDIQASGQSAEPVLLDIIDKQMIDNLIERLDEKYGRIDAVVNCAYPRNQNWGRLFENVEYEDFCINVNLHLGGYFLIAQRFCNYFRKQGHGNLVNISSIYGSMVPRFEIYEGTEMTMPVEYAAIKSAIQQLSRYVARYYRGDGIRCNTLSPGGVEAGQPKEFLTAYNSYCGTKGMLDPDDLVQPLLFLLSDASSYISGQDIIVDDGFSM